MGKVEDLLDERDAIEEKIKAAMKEEKKEAKKAVRKLCMQFGFTSFDLRGALSLTATEAKEAKGKK